MDEDAAREFRGMPNGVGERGDNDGRRRAGSNDVVPPGEGMRKDGPTGVAAGPATAAFAALWDEVGWVFLADGSCASPSSLEKEEDPRPAMAVDGDILAGEETRRASAADGEALAQISVRKWLARNHNPNAARGDKAARVGESRTSGAPVTSGPIAGTRGAIGPSAIGTGAISPSRARA